MLMMMMWKDEADGALDPWSCSVPNRNYLHLQATGTQKVNFHIWYNLSTLCKDAGCKLLMLLMCATATLIL